MIKWQYLSDEEKLEFIKKNLINRKLVKVYFDTSVGYDLLVLEFDKGIKLKISDGEYGDLRCISIHEGNKELIKWIKDKEVLISFEEESFREKYPFEWY